MSEIKILSQKSTEQNEFYDPARSNNGGGYSQPCRETVFEYEGEQSYSMILRVGILEVDLPKHYIKMVKL